MPVYRWRRRKGVLTWDAPREGSELKPKREAASIYRKGRKRLLDGAMKWSVNHSILSEIANANPDFDRHLQKLLEADPAPVIVDWGCGEGDGISQIKKLAPNATCIGYSREAHPKEWQTHTQGTIFIHGPLHDLHRYLARLKKPVNLIYSRYGLYNIQDEKEEKALKKELDLLVPKLAPKGMLTTNIHRVPTSPQFEYSHPLATVTIHQRELLRWGGGRHPSGFEMGNRIMTIRKKA